LERLLGITFAELWLARDQQLSVEYEQQGYLVIIIGVRISRLSAYQHSAKYCYEAKKLVLFLGPSLTQHPTPSSCVDY
jgi:hypothetical protein